MGLTLIDLNNGLLRRPTGRFNGIRLGVLQRRAKRLAVRFKPTPSVTLAKSDEKRQACHHSVAMLSYPSNFNKQLCRRSEEGRGPMN